MTPKLSHREYLEIVRRMTPEQRLQKVFELSEQSRSLIAHELRERFPDLNPAEFGELLRSQMDSAHELTYEDQLLGIRPGSGENEVN